jgi:iron complex transport system ATP-binding protein
MAEVEHATYRVGDTVILDDVSVNFVPGAFNVILGPNGAGKSTLLAIATGLLRPTSGQVRYGDRLVGEYSATALARKRAVLSQRVELAFPLDVEDVVLMGRYPHYGRTPSKRDREIVTRALELVGMTARRRQRYTTLSGGEQQKVQLARVLAQIWNYDEPREPRFLFLDEPTTSLDIHYQLHLLDVARGILDYDCTVIAILHDITMALQYGDVFFLMEDGRVVHEAHDAADVPAELVERVFRVRASRVADPADGQPLWRFSL